MKGKSKFFVGLFAAVLTFGSLMAFVGSPHFNKHQCCGETQQCDNHNETVQSNTNAVSTFK
jgi:hypothetical protein